MTAALVLLAGLVVLVAAGAAIVDAAAALGGRLGLSPLVVGLTIVAAGTSAPELAVVWRAADAGDAELALGSVIGSNISNILLVLGLVAVVGAVPVSRRAVRIDVPVMIVASLAVLLLARDGRIDRADGALLVAGLVGYVGYTIAVARRADRPVDPADGGPGRRPPAVRPAPTPRPRRRPLWGSIGLFGVGVVGVAVSAQFVVRGAEDLALSLGVPELVVGLTVLAIGTSAPEIATSVIAAVRGQRDVALGNAIGSNVFNLLFVLGLVAVTHRELVVAEPLRQLDLPVMVGAAVLCLPFAMTGARINRFEGSMFVLLYLAYSGYLVLDAVEHGWRDAIAIVALGGIVPIATVITVIGIIRDRQRRDGRPTGAVERTDPSHSPLDLASSRSPASTRDPASAHDLPSAHEIAPPHDTVPTSGTGQACHTGRTGGTGSASHTGPASEGVHR